MVGWYVEGDEVQLDVAALSRLMSDVVSEGREFNAVLVWNYSRLSRNAAEFAELRRTLLEISVGYPECPAWCCLAELADGLDDEAAG